MSIVTGTTTASGVAITYKGQCNQCSAYCASIGDWMQGHPDCGVSSFDCYCNQPRIPLTPKGSTYYPIGVCPTILGVQPLGNITIPNPSSCDYKGTCPVQCSYNSDDFKTTDQVNLFIDYFGTADDTFNTVLLPKFCVNTVTTCPTYLLSTGNIYKPETCARAVSTVSDDSAICGPWSTNLKYNGNIQGAFNSYCNGLDYKTNPECDCVSRASDPLYTLIGQPINDFCWWIPCKNTATYLVPPIYTNDAGKPNACPSSICEQVVNVFNNSNSNVNFPNAKNYIQCGGLNPGGGGGGGGGAAVNSWISKNWIYLVIGIAVFLFLLGVIIIVIIVVMKHKSTPNVKDNKEVKRSGGVKQVKQPTT